MAFLINLQQLSWHIFDEMEFIFYILYYYQLIKFKLTPKITAYPYINHLSTPIFLFISILFSLFYRRFYFHFFVVTVVVSIRVKRETVDFQLYSNAINNDNLHFRFIFCFVTFYLFMSIAFI